eukprot:357056-Chlamydomonas_euryale.AAC.5
MPRSAGHMSPHPSNAVGSERRQVAVAPTCACRLDHRAHISGARFLGQVAVDMRRPAHAAPTIARTSAVHIF